ncbi:hypothetical protein [Rhodanobacter sp. C05]|uniref:hypothetical protein n=1 Tax=Rhodanobacter sp. C05 TaxID=1945855 RepID=UPI000987C49D|nr:hypothetical protein [Rhodanobacter sp. C05]OOG38175.1 hypothetical protein B0E51_15160 [Rhodanobacter sp. C05]
MNISETYLILGAAAFELGVPVAAIATMVRAPRLRKFAVVVLGAVTPPVLFYCLVAVSYFLNPASTENVFAFYAMSVMSFAAYVAFLLVGAALAFAPKPSNLYARFFVGFAFAPLSCYLLNLVFWWRSMA